MPDGPYGHCDLAGNVLEWCRDELNEGKGRPLRGGAWWFDAGVVRAAIRGRDGPGSRYVRIGFRVLWSPPSLGS